MCHKFSTEEIDRLTSCCQQNPNFHNKQASDSDFISPKAFFKRHGQKNHSREQMSRTKWTHAQEGNSLSDRAPSLNFSLTHEFLSTMMTEDDKDITQHVSIFHYETKPVQTLHSWIQNTAESKYRQCLLGGEVPFVCLLQSKLAPYFSYYAIPTTSAGKYLGRTQKQKQCRHIYYRQYISMHFTATSTLEYIYTGWLTDG